MDRELSPGPPSCSHLGQQRAGYPRAHAFPLWTSQPPASLCRRIPRLEKPQGCRAVEGGASPCCGIPSLSESLHCKNVRHAEDCTKNSVSLFCFRLSPPEIHLRGPAGRCVDRGALSTYRQTYKQPQICTDVTLKHTAHRHTEVHTDIRRNQVPNSSSFVSWGSKTLGVRPTLYTHTNTHTSGSCKAHLLSARFTLEN